MIADITLPPVIGLCGLAKSGKTTVADYLVTEYGYRRIKFADPLKDMLRALGLTYQEIEGDRKEDSCRLLGGKSPRFAMQTLGTEWGRQMISPTLWVDLWEHRVLDSRRRQTPVVVDDCRFSNELEVLKRLGGLSITIVREGNEPVNDHISERIELATDVTIRNDRTVGDLISRVLSTISNQ
jgi:hypothetical protein